LIAEAYNLESFQIISKTELEREHFDVIATYASGTTKEQFRKMWGGPLG
jgi:uncharacterized protein (TIGR03435 family)